AVELFQKAGRGACKWKIKGLAGNNCAVFIKNCAGLFGIFLQWEIMPLFLFVFSEYGSGKPVFVARCIAYNIKIIDGSMGFKDCLVKSMAQGLRLFLIIFSLLYNGSYMGKIRLNQALICGVIMDIFPVDFFYLLFHVWA
ncbi:MAG: hypothetical protein LBH04_06645, partial [Tannerellaceae bacterium]|nr:hypothetical protein [Tannerellaceae bacterium]